MRALGSCGPDATTVCLGCRWRRGAGGQPSTAPNATFTFTSGLTVTPM